jgi:exosortase
MKLGGLMNDSWRRVAVPAGLVGVALLWASWPSLAAMADRWSHDPRYSHGYLMPAFAAYLLWTRRGLLAGAPGRPSWWGVALLGVGAAMKAAGAFYYYGWFDAASLLVSLAGLAVLVGGRPALRWAWPAVGILVFMVPLPYRVEQAMGAPLQQVATLASTYALQTLGLSAVNEGNIIYLDRGVIGVAEACNGLGMLYMFLAFAAAAALVVRRPAADRVILVLSAAPIALLANVARITITGVLTETAGKGAADTFYHDLAGWLMMPLAVAALLAELGLLSRLFVEGQRPEPRPVGPLGVVAGGAAGPPRGQAGRGTGAASIHLT